METKEELESYIEHLRWIFNRRSREQLKLFEEIQELIKKLEKLKK